jgi:hypothetical protein
VPVEKPPDRRKRRRPAALAEPLADLCQSQIGCLGDQLQQPLPVLLDRRRAPITALRQRCHRAAAAPPLRQLDHKARADGKHRRHSTHAATGFDLLNHPFSKIH